jgi:hypothetical protein
MGGLILAEETLSYSSSFQRALLENMILLFIMLRHNLEDCEQVVIYLVRLA